ncbi:tRNA glutamyl-Q(34) synthetase GluQRS [Aeromicrobium sp. Leaf350]|uniref:tRNA glutamyl-Q(34) synthetase GluQRS n=1 Tax=Aeromicrobium sp. Leaf350 TaxID=2876565 RepID=UPI001E4F8F49|nr:tRNA glutamyl-Q(34) synthetase GluQRS [Aeromicrobium sp. Leaf350]
MSAGRYAPSPSGDLHVGNLRTAVLAWLFARSSGRDFLMRVDDLDRVREGAAERQLADLATLGLDWDGPVLWQSSRVDAHAQAVARLTDAGLTFECFCTRREVLEAPSAPHRPPGAYPGTCRDLTEAEREDRRRERPAAVRLRADVDSWTVRDELHGDVTADVDDLVLRRGDGVPAYNLTVVLDDAHQGVDQVVRGDDLLTSAPRQAYLATLLDLPVPSYAHVPLALNADGARLAKRDGAVTLTELRDAGVDVLAMIGGSLGFRGAGPQDWLDELDPEGLPREPWVVRPPALG